MGEVSGREDGGVRETEIQGSDGDVVSGLTGENRAARVHPSMGRVRVLPTMAQDEALYEFLSEHRWLALDKNLGVNQRQQKRLWTQAAAQLNQLEGCRKDAINWCQHWLDKKLQFMERLLRERAEPGYVDRQERRMFALLLPEVAALCGEHFDPLNHCKNTVVPEVEADSSEIVDMAALPNSAFSTVSRSCAAEARLRRLERRHLLLMQQRLAATQRLLRVQRRHLAELHRLRTEDLERRKREMLWNRDSLANLMHLCED